MMRACDYFTVSTALPPRRPDPVRLLAWFSLVWAVSFTLAHAVIS